MNGKQRIVSALNLEPVDRTPVWFMRQAGRHLPEYRKLAADHNFWERCMDVDLCTRITLQPLERYKKIDAAIIFSDILTPLPSLGYDVEYGGGIRISDFNLDDVDDWTNFSARKHAPWAADGLKSVGEVVGETNARLGFVGSPWTICMYLLSGGTGDKDFHNARAKIYSNPEKAKHMLMKMGRLLEICWRTKCCMAALMQYNYSTPGQGYFLRKSTVNLLCQQQPKRSKFSEKKLVIILLSSIMQKAPDTFILRFEN